MKNIFQSDGTNTQEKEDVELIKTDIQNLMAKIGNLKEDSVSLLSEQFNNFISTVGDLRDKGKCEIRNGISELYSSTRQHPFRNLMYAFAAGTIISFLCKCKK